MNQPDSGNVYYDGHDLRHLNIKQLRSQIGVVPQDSQLYPQDCCSARMLGADKRSKALIRFDSEGSNFDAEQHTAFHVYIDIPLSRLIRRAARSSCSAQRIVVRIGELAGA